MVKKKEDDAFEKKVNDDIEKTVTIYDWTIPFKALECPNMFKAGLKSYIVDNNIEIKSDKEFNKIMQDFKTLAKGLDGYRSKFNRYKWVSDVQPEYKIKDNYFDIFKKEFNKGHSVQPYYSIIFEENDPDNRDYNVDRTFKFFIEIAEQFCKEFGFTSVDDDKTSRAHVYLTGKDSEKFEGFKVVFHADTEYSIYIEYDKRIIKEK